MALGVSGEFRKSEDRRARVQAILSVGTEPTVSPAEASASGEQDRFVARARALFFARMMFLSLGLAILAVPAWSRYFELSGPIALAGYVTMLLYSVANFIVIDHKVAGRYVTYVTLCLDLVVMVILISKPHTGGGLQNPLLATQLLFTTLFAILFPRPLAIMPPLLVLLVTERLDLLLQRDVTAVELFTVLWYLALNVIIVYVIVYLNLSARRPPTEKSSSFKAISKSSPSSTSEAESRGKSTTASARSSRRSSFNPNICSV